jgi:chromosome segregation ATPase
VSPKPRVETTTLTNLLHEANVDIRKNPDGGVLLHRTRSGSRACGYSQCDHEVEYDGAGRPPEYCTDRRWPGGKTCKQMAAAERDAVRAAGLDAQLDAFDSTAQRLILWAGPLNAHLADLQGALDNIHTGALTRVGDAERKMAEALVRAEQAERESHRMQQALRDVERQAAVVMEKGAETERRAAQVKQEAEARVAETLDRLAVVEREHGQAQARAQAAETAARVEAKRRERADQRTVVLEQELARARHTVDQTRAAADVLRARLESADETMRVVHDRVQQVEQLLAVETARGHTHEQRLAEALVELGEATADRDELRRQVAEATAAGRAATDRADRAEARHDDLVAKLATLAHGGDTAEKGGPA